MVFNKLLEPTAIRIFVYAAFALLACILRMHPSNNDVSSDAFMMIFALGPVAVLLDMITPMRTTRLRHHIETAVRVALLMALYSLMLPGLAVSPVSATTMGHLFNVCAMYFAVFCALNKFSIQPTQWLGRANRTHTVFLVAMVTAIVLSLGAIAPYRGAGVWLLAAMVVGLQLAWRHAVWHNASQTMSSAQHADVWPALAKNNDAHRFWGLLYRYSTITKTASMPGAALATLSLPMLLTHFKNGVVDCSDTQPYQQVFEDCVKAAISHKEPRAEFIWQLYPLHEAVEYIANIEHFVGSNQTESMELPEL